MKPSEELTKIGQEIFKQQHAEEPEVIIDINHPDEMTRVKSIINLIGIQFQALYKWLDEREKEL